MTNKINYNFFHKNNIFSNNKILFDSINQFFSNLNIFFSNNFKFFLFEGKAKNVFNTTTLKKKTDNIIYKDNYYYIFKLSENAFLFTFYNNEFIIYLNIKSNSFFGIMTKPERFHYDFFREFIIMPVVAFRLIFENIYFFHSSVFSVNNKGFLISGNSGKGKSTLTFLLLESFNNKIFLSDDKAFLKKYNKYLYGGGFKSLIKIKNPELPYLKKYLKNKIPEMTINKINFYKYEDKSDEIKLNYLIFPTVKKNEVSSLKVLSKKELYFYLIENSYKMNLTVNKNKYLDFLEQMVQSSTGFVAVLGKNMNAITQEISSIIKQNSNYTE